MLSIGKMNTLTIDQDTGRGLILKSEDGQEVFLPSSFAKRDLEVGASINVFVYLNTQGDIIATTETPYAQVGEYALLRVVETQEFGAFFDWGIDKDLLVPGNEQKLKVRNHEDHIVRVCLEDETNRIYGTTKLGKYIEADDKDIKERDTVEVELVHQSDLGFRVIINKKYIGMIYHNEIFSKVRIKDKAQGIVKKIRDDGLIDISLQRLGVSKLEDAKITVLNFLKDNDGKSYLNDKSSPEEIKHNLQMSKKSFKAAIGMLYKEGMIIIETTGIKLK